MDVTLGAFIKSLAAGMPVAVLLFFAFVAGFRRVWVWERELVASEAAHLREMTIMQARLSESQAACSEWKALALQLMHTTRDTVAVLPKAG